jgi:p-aminobenzoyl-glutamate transporter AbgT
MMFIILGSAPAHSILELYSISGSGSATLLINLFVTHCLLSAFTKKYSRILSFELILVCDNKLSKNH